AQHAPRGGGKRARRFFQVRVDAGERRVHALDRLRQKADQIGYDEDPDRAVQPRDVGVVEQDQAQAEDCARDRVADLNGPGQQRGPRWTGRASRAVPVIVTYERRRRSICWPIRTAMVIRTSTNDNMAAAAWSNRVLS